MKKFTNDQIKDMKVGQIFYECGYGTNLEAKVLTAPVVEDVKDGKGNIKWQAECTQTGRIIDYAVNESMTAYGLNLHEKPQYVQVVDGEVTYPRMGGTAIKYEDVELQAVTDAFEAADCTNESPLTPG